MSLLPRGFLPFSFLAVLMLFIVFLHGSFGFFVARKDDAPPACATCNITQTLRLEDVQKRVLKEIGLKEVPEPFDIPEQVRQVALRKHIFGSSDERNHWLTSVEIVAHDIATQGLPTASFDFSRQTMRRQVVRAALLVHLRRPDETHRSSDAEGEDVDESGVLVKVFERMRSGELGEMIASHRHAVPTTAEEEQILIVLDHDDVMSWWTGEKPQFAGLFVSAVYRGKNLAIHPQDDDSNMKDMVLAMKLKKTPSRRKREEKSCVNNLPGGRGCCLHDLFVDFKKMGWTFVVAPQRYNAFVCSGACASRDITAVHAQAARLGQMNRENVVGGTCCHPADYEPLEIIYITPEKEVVTAAIDGMVARSCACS